MELIPEVREAAGVPADVLSDLRVERLLHSQDRDVPATVGLVKKHIEFIRRFDGEVASPAVEDVLLTERFRLLGLNKDRCPVFVVNYLWGAFLEVPGGIDTLLSAYVVFLRRASATVKLELGVEDGPKFISISVGGPPPMPFTRALMNFREAHFPEDISQAILYPLNEESARGRMVQTFVRNWNMQSVQMISSVEELIRSANVHEGFIPDDVLHVAPPTADQTGAVMRDRSDMLMAEHPEPIVSSSNAQFVVRNTFIEVAEDFDFSPPAPRHQRSLSVARSEDADLADVSEVGTQFEAPDMMSIDADCPNIHAQMHAQWLNCDSPWLTRDSPCFYPTGPDTGHSFMGGADPSSASTANDSYMNNAWAIPSVINMEAKQNDFQAWLNHLDAKAAELHAEALQFEATALCVRAAAIRAQAASLKPPPESTKSGGKWPQGRQRGHPPREPGKGDKEGGKGDKQQGKGDKEGGSGDKQQGQQSAGKPIPEVSTPADATPSVRVPVLLPSDFEKKSHAQVRRKAKALLRRKEAEAAEAAAAQGGPTATAAASSNADIAKASTGANGCRTSCSDDTMQQTQQEGSCPAKKPGRSARRKMRETGEFPQKDDKKEVPAGEFPQKDDKKEVPAEAAAQIPEAQRVLPGEASQQDT